MNEEDAVKHIHGIKVRLVCDDKAGPHLEGDSVKLLCHGAALTWAKEVLADAVGFTEMEIRPEDVLGVVAHPTPVSQRFEGTLCDKAGITFTVSLSPGAIAPEVMEERLPHLREAAEALRTRIDGLFSRVDVQFELSGCFFQAEVGVEEISPFYMEPALGVRYGT